MKRLVGVLFILMLLSLVAFSRSAEAGDENWVYISDYYYGSALYYDSNSVKIDNDKKTFEVTVEIVYSGDAKRAEIEYAKKDGYYTPEMEKMSYLVEDLDFNYSSSTYLLVDWGYYADDGTELYWTLGPEEWNSINEPKGYEYPLVLQRVTNDFNIN